MLNQVVVIELIQGNMIIHSYTKYVIDTNGPDPNVLKLKIIISDPNFFYI